MLPKLTLRIQLVGYLGNDFGAVVIRNSCFAKHNSAQSPFAQIVHVPQSLRPGTFVFGKTRFPLQDWPTVIPTVDTKHKTERKPFCETG